MRDRAECQEPGRCKALWSKETSVDEFVGSETCLILVINKLCKEGMSALKAQMKDSTSEMLSVLI